VVILHSVDELDVIAAWETLWTPEPVGDFGGEKNFAPALNRTTILPTKSPCLVQAIILKLGYNERKADEMDKDCSSPMTRRERK
jgi:hypothetical protein